MMIFDPGGPRVRPLRRTPAPGMDLRCVPAAAAILGCILVPGAAAAQVGEAAFEQGRRLYEARCARCHGAGGEGAPPTFPALSGNGRLADAAGIVGVLRAGSGNMPPFPTLTADEIAALAGFVRNAWGNDFGGVTAADVAAAAETAADAEPAASVRDGVFTAEQAARGRLAYSGACGFCHGRRLNGAPDDPDVRSTPPLARARFLREWDGRSLAALFEYTRLTMPEDNPASLTAAEYVDVIAYMLSVSGMPPGDDELPADPRRLARIVVRQR